MTQADWEFISDLVHREVGRRIEFAPGCKEINGFPCEPHRGCGVCQAYAMLERIKPEETTDA